MLISTARAPTLYNINGEVQFADILAVIKIQSPNDSNQGVYKKRGLDRGRRGEDEAIVTLFSSRHVTSAFHVTTLFSLRVPACRCRTLSTPLNTTWGQVHGHGEQAHLWTQFQRALGGKEFKSTALGKFYWQLVNFETNSWSWMIE